MTPSSVVRGEQLVERNSIFYRVNEDPISDYRRRWEAEAAEDPVRSAIADNATDESLAELTAKTSSLWDRIPEGQRFDTVLEVGSGYGRIPLYLAHLRGSSWSTYVAVDISENMLRELLRHNERFGANPEAALFAVCVSAETLPVADDSVDLAITSAVFLHMGKSFVHRAVAEIARTLKPGGAFIFETSFPNARNPANFPARLKPKRLRPPNYMKFWTRGEIERLIRDSGLAAKVGGFTIESASYTLLPKQVGPVPIPLARRVNAALGTPPQRVGDVLASTYDVYSDGVLA